MGLPTLLLQHADAMTPKFKIIAYNCLVVKDHP